METWAVFQAGYGLDEVYHIRYHHSFRQTCSEKKFNLIVCFVAFTLHIGRFKFSSVNKMFGICTENKHSIF